MKLIYLILFSTILIHSTNSKSESNYDATGKPATSTPKTQPKPNPEKEKKTMGERQRNITLKELIQAIFNKIQSGFTDKVSGNKTDRCDCHSCCKIQNLTHATVLPLFKEIFRVFITDCKNKNEGGKESCPCVPVDQETNELDYRAWVEELKNHRVKLYRSPKKCEGTISQQAPKKRFEAPKKRIEARKRKCEDSSLSVDCNDCSLVKSEDKNSVWLICKGCKVLNPSSYREFSKTGCLLNFDRIENKLVRIRTPYLQWNDPRSDRRNDGNEFICPKFSFVTRKKEK